VQRDVVLKFLYMQWIRMRFGLRHVHRSTLILAPKAVCRDFVAGRDCFVNAGSRIGPHVLLDDYVLIGPDVIFTGDDHRLDIIGVPIIFSGRPALRPTRVERDVWIGARSVILSGVTIGSGAVIAAGAIVTRDVPPFAIVGGVPAKFLRWRFECEEDREAHSKQLTRGDFLRSFANKKQRRDV